MTDIDTHIYNFYSGEEKSMCQCKMIFVMVISKVEKPLRVHFYRKYEIIFSAVSGLHVEFAADYMPT